MQVIERKKFQVLQRSLEDQRILVITGMRGVGKTTALKWLLDQVASINKVYLDLGRMDQRSVFEQHNVDDLVSYLGSLGLTIHQPLTIALDEIQAAPNALPMVKFLYDRYHVKFILAGCTSLYLKNHFSETLADRKLIFELTPLGFGEFLDFHGIPYRQRVDWQEMQFDRQEFNRLKDLYGEFVTYGGLPAVVMEPRPKLKQEVLTALLSTYINQDVGSLAEFRKLSELQLLLQVLSMRIGKKLDPVNLSNIVGISRPTLNGYLDFLEKTYIISQLPAFAGPDKALALGRRIYFCDNGFAGTLANPGEGAFFENAVYNQLRAYGVDSFYSLSSESEIDFILAPTQSAPAALKVEYHPLKSDHLRLQRVSRKVEIPQAWMVGRYPTPGFEQFVWGGLIF